MNLTRGSALLICRSSHSRCSLPGFSAASESRTTASKAEPMLDRKSTRLNSSHSQISYAVFCLKKKTPNSIPYPAPSNIPILQHLLDCIYHAQSRSCDFLLDAAAFTPANRLDLERCSPDFVVQS